MKKLILIILLSILFIGCSQVEKYNNSYDDCVEGGLNDDGGDFCKGYASNMAIDDTNPARIFLDCIHENNSDDYCLSLEDNITSKNIKIYEKLIENQKSEYVIDDLKEIEDIKTCSNELIYIENQTLLRDKIFYETRYHELYRITNNQQFKINDLESKNENWIRDSIAIADYINVLENILYLRYNWDGNLNQGVTNEK